jgi:hypothetical protein
MKRRVFPWMRLRRRIYRKRKKRRRRRTFFEILMILSLVTRVRTVILEAGRVLVGVCRVVE